MSDDIEIPEVYISAGWAVSDLETVEDCEDAYILLMTICATIEGKIDDMENGLHARETMGSTRAALKWKKLALNLVNLKKAKFARIEKMNAEKAKEKSRDGLVLSYVSSEAPELLRTAGLWADGVISRRKFEATT